mgnify:CR=1 FL=1
MKNYSKQKDIPMDNYILVIAEKPKAAQKIAEALNASRKIVINGVSIWFTHWNGVFYVIAPAAGHLFTLTTDDVGYPTFNFKWVPRHLVDKGSRYAKKYFEVLKILSQKAVGFINACDYDVEGSLIGYMIIRNFGDIRKARRAKFSSLTPVEIRRAFSNLSSIDYNMVETGYCRHVLDWLWGINISRMLMDLYKQVFGKRSILSAGRVQTPTLVYATDLVLRRRLHVPIPYAIIDISLGLGNKMVKPIYEGDSIDSLDKAKQIIEKIKARPYATIKKVYKEVKVYSPPHPFNLPDLQKEAYRIYRISPHKTQKIAEDLYLDALISYPRTNSQKLPQTLDVKNILNMIGLNKVYRDLVKQLIEETNGVLKPNNGPLDDPAHPAIYPTGEMPRKLDYQHEKIYDLIVRRFLATFSTPLKIMELKVVLDVHGLQYSITANKILDHGWLKYYPYSHIEEDQYLANYKFIEGEEIPIKRFGIKTMYTKAPLPPSRISLLKWMESVDIGTESTRAEIIELLFDRGYLKSKSRSVDVSDTGLFVTFLLKKYVEDLVSVSLTRKFEEYLRDIREGKIKCDGVVEEAKNILSRYINNVLKIRSTIIHDIFSVVPCIDNASCEAVKNKRMCKICRRFADESGFCIFHRAAWENLLREFEKWKRFGFDWRSYLKKILSLKSSGLYVREVAYYILNQEPEKLSPI